MKNLTDKPPRWAGPGTCEGCVYLGEWKQFDLYACAKHDTVMATTIEENERPGAYRSGREFGVPGHGSTPELVEALTRAIAAGVLTE